MSGKHYAILGIVVIVGVLGAFYLMNNVASIGGAVAKK